jgi:hypothetical protein
VADFDTLNASAEDVLLRSVGDFRLLAPRSQALAAGRDGQLAGWSLTSATVPDFAARGVGPGAVCILDGIGGVNSVDRKDIAEAYFGVAAAGGPLTLRPPGQAPGAGVPPAYPAGQSVPFRVPDLAPQLGIAARRVQRRYNLVDPAQLRSPGDLVDLVVALTCMDLYFEKSRQADRPDDLLAKWRILKDQVGVLFAESDARYPAYPSRGQVGGGRLGVGPSPWPAPPYTVRPTWPRPGRHPDPYWPA